MKLDHFQGVASARLHDMILKNKYYAEVTTRGSLRNDQEPQRTAGFSRVSKDISSISCTNRENEVRRGKVSEPRSHREV